MDNSTDINDNSKRQPFLSIIIPAFNEEERLPDTLHRIITFVKSQHYTVEVLIVDNASTDMTGTVISNSVPSYPFFKSLYEHRRGKGAAVRKGILSARGEYILICDADMAVPIEEVEKFLPPRINDYDIAIGSREAPGAQRYGEPLYRHLMGRVFNVIVQCCALPGIHDSQCGFKSFRRAAAHDLFSVSKLDGWSFDVEILYIALLRGYRISEVPVNWYYGKNSKINPIYDSWQMFKEVIKVRWNGLRGLYNIKQNI